MLPNNANTNKICCKSKLLVVQKEQLVVGRHSTVLVELGVHEGHHVGVQVWIVPAAGHVHRLPLSLSPLFWNLQCANGNGIAANELLPASVAGSYKTSKTSFPTVASATSKYERRRNHVWEIRALRETICLTEKKLSMKDSVMKMKGPEPILYEADTQKSHSVQHD